MIECMLWTIDEEKRGKANESQREEKNKKHPRSERRWKNGKAMMHNLSFSAASFLGGFSRSSQRANWVVKQKRKERRDTG